MPSATEGVGSSASASPKFGPFAQPLDRFSLLEALGVGSSVRADPPTPATGCPCRPVGAVRLTRKRIVVLLNRAIVLGEVEVGTFRLDESDLIAVKAFADGVTA